MKRKYIVALTQQAIHQVFQHRRAIVRLQPLAVDDAHAAMVVRMRFQQELPQQGFGLRGGGAMQVQFVLIEN